MIETPENLSKDILDQISAEFMASIQAVSMEDMDYVIHRYDVTMMKLRVANDWRRQISQVCDMMLSLYNHVDEGGAHLPEDARRSVAAALHYVCKPFDVISDNIPGLGFVDDAHVLNICLSQLQELCPEALRRAKKQHNL